MRLPRREKEKSEYGPRGRPVARASQHRDPPALSSSSRSSTDAQRQRGAMWAYIPKDENALELLQYTKLVKSN
jgi:hypothetical protein